MSQIAPYLGFNGTCREAMTFYQQCLGGDLTLNTVADSPIADQMPPEAANNILHSTLQNGGATLLGSDMMGAKPVQGNNVSISLDCGSEEEINRFFSALAVGGHITHAVKVEFWGGTFGALTDKFGINWMLTYDKNQH